MSDRAEAQLHNMMEQAAAHVPRQPPDLEGKMGAFYKSFMDEARVDRLGAKPIVPQLADVRAAKSRDDFAALMGRNASDFEGTVFSFGIDVDLKDPKRYAVYVGQSGLGLPDRDCYFKAEFDVQKKKYQACAAQLLRLLDWPDADVRAADIVDLESKIARASWSKAQQRDPVATYNPMSISDLQKYARGFAWTAFLRDAGVARVARVIVAEKTAFPKIAAVFAFRSWCGVEGRPDLSTRRGRLLVRAEASTPLACQTS